MNDPLFGEDDWLSEQVFHSIINLGESFFWSKYPGQKHKENSALH